MNLDTQPVLGLRVPFYFNVPFIVVCFATALVIAVLAAALPAWRAARQQVVEALRSE
jgi:ABC-type lipoprotein release transport system permease subunit